jgi:hypothetical protein
MAKLQLSPIPEATIQHYRATGDWTYDTDGALLNEGGKNRV